MGNFTGKVPNVNGFGGYNPIIYAPINVKFGLGAVPNFTFIGAPAGCKTHFGLLQRNIGTRCVALLVSIDHRQSQVSCFTFRWRHRWRGWNHFRRLNAFTQILIWMVEISFPSILMRKRDSTTYGSKFILCKSLCNFLLEHPVCYSFSIAEKRKKSEALKGSFWCVDCWITLVGSCL